MADQLSTVKQTQTWLKTLGFYTLSIDGQWGKGSRDALAALLAASIDNSKPYGLNVVAWGSKFSNEEIAKVNKIVSNLRWPKLAVQWLMGSIAFETGRTFDPSETNSIGATGLIQFIPPTAIVYFNTDAQIRAMTPDQKKAAGIAACKRLAGMSVLEQLDYVEKYFTPYAGKINNLGDVYLSILYPAGVGKADDWVLWDKNKMPTTYAQNAGLDMDGNGFVTRDECCHRVTNLMVEGFLNDKPRKY